MKTLLLLILTMSFVACGDSGSSGDSGSGALNTNSNNSRWTCQNNIAYASGVAIQNCSSINQVCSCEDADNVGVIDMCSCVKREVTSPKCSAGEVLSPVTGKCVVEKKSDTGVGTTVTFYAGTDLKSCKAKYYYSDAKTKLNLTDQNWCGDFANRFSKANTGNANDFIYDKLLEGYWSPKSSSYMTWADAVSYCTNLGNGFALPDAYKILSLFSQIDDTNEGYINPIFDDNDRDYFWSSTKESSSRAWRFSFLTAGVYPSLVDPYVWVRCFRPN